MVGNYWNKRDIIIFEAGKWVSMKLRGVGLLEGESEMEWRLF